jgi:DNA-binding transcriptional MerR regulator
MTRIAHLTAAFTLTAILIGGAGTLQAFGPHGHGGRFLCGVRDQLTEEQLDEVNALIDGMREEGASPCEIHEAVRETVEGYGIEMPEPPEHAPFLVHVLERLDEEQRAEVRDTIDRMRDEGAAPCEIHEAVRELLDEYGVELPMGPGHRHGRRYGPGADRW